MERLKLTLEYDGIGFRGWAAQPGLRTVESTVREAFDRVFARWSELAVAGRTDTGVHALGQVASVEAEGGLDVALAQSALWSGTGGELESPDDAPRGSVVLACAPDVVGRLEGVQLIPLGTAGGDSLLGHPLAELANAWGPV